MDLLLILWIMFSNTEMETNKEVKEEIGLPRTKHVEVHLWQLSSLF